MGFSAAFLHGRTLDAHYVGLDDAYNERHAVYQRMLVDHPVSRHPASGVAHHLRRTAEQAKSNLGAVPEDMYFMVRHRNHVANKLHRSHPAQCEAGPFERRDPFKRVTA